MPITNAPGLFAGAESASIRTVSPGASSPEAAKVGATPVLADPSPWFAHTPSVPSSKRTVVPPTAKTLFEVVLSAIPLTKPPPLISAIHGALYTAHGARNARVP